MVFIEAAPFTKYLRDYLNDNEYSELQSFLIKQPEAGDLIQVQVGCVNYAGAWITRVNAEELGLFITGRYQKTKFTYLPSMQKMKYQICRVMKRKRSKKCWRIGNDYYKETKFI